MMTSAATIGQSIRQQRVAKDIAQDVLASAAGISRATLIQIEKGKDARLSSLEGVGRVLGLQIGIVAESPELVRRRQARADNEAKLAVSREKHLKIAVQLALGGSQAQTLKTQALRMVRLWKERALCSPVYIERWQQILDAPPRDIARSLLALDADAWGPALRQNTPFAVSAT